eukprot:TRINITY_DN1170_c0_g1_i1.p1 TRINITY_DN1170_c0_g1~~TRINITY_DN1170_c0_g1_i1.p1  ORF type:complete len:609 (-),score=156.95 TRINITY_DN1170_c0_g1_i1:836-2662(-)
MQLSPKIIPVFSHMLLPQLEFLQYGSRGKRPKSAAASTSASRSRSAGRPSSSSRRRPVTSTGRSSSSSAMKPSSARSTRDRQSRKPAVPTRPRSAMARSGRSNANTRRRPQSAVARMTSDSETDDFNYLHRHRPSSSNRNQGKTRSSALASGGRRGRLAKQVSTDSGLTDYLDSDDEETEITQDDDDEWIDLLDDDDEGPMRSKSRRKTTRKTANKRKSAGKKRPSSASSAGERYEYTVSTGAPDPFMHMGGASSNRNRPSQGEFAYDDPYLMHAHQYQSMMRAMHAAGHQSGGYYDPYSMGMGGMGMPMGGPMYHQSQFDDSGYGYPQQQYLHHQSMQMHPQYSQPMMQSDQSEMRAPPPPSSPQATDGQSAGEDQPKESIDQTGQSSRAVADSRGQESGQPMYQQQQQQHDTSPIRSSQFYDHQGFQHGQPSMGMGPGMGMGMGGMEMMEDPYMSQYGMGMAPMMPAYGYPMQGMQGYPVEYGNGMEMGGFDPYGGHPHYHPHAQHQQQFQHSLHDGYEWAPVPPEVQMMMEQQSQPQHQPQPQQVQQDQQEQVEGDDDQQEEITTPVKHPQIAALQQEDFGGSPSSSGTPSVDTSTDSVEIEDQE